MESKELEEHFLVKKKHRIFNGDQKNIVLGGPKERKARKGLSKSNDGYRSGFRPYQPDKGEGKDHTQNKGRVEDHQGK